ncbi:FG-GAP-like repeat-containing protein [Phenylobacterium sp.]|uniref:FG-GAP-like repeat-containing protein n=1 Tax=Phenylobacterium sp. TaxID=1871053 RepID=UPI002FE18546
MAGPADFVLNPLPSSVQWNVGLFSAREVGTPLVRGDVGQVLYHAMGDLTGDGWPEIVVTGWSYRGWDAVGTPPEVPITVISTGPNGPTMLDAATFLGRDSSPGTAILRIADFTGDGRNDLMMVGHNESPFVTTPSFLFVRTDAGFVQQTVGPKVAAHEGEVGDINGDGLPDMVLSAYWAEKTLEPFLYTGNGGNWVQGISQDGAVLLLQVNQGGGAFTPLPLVLDRPLEELKTMSDPWNATNWSSGSASIIADLDGDGRPEVVVTDLYSSLDWKDADTYVITDIELGATMASGRLIALPQPYFEADPKYAGMNSQLGDQLSHDIQLQVLDFDNDGLKDILVFSMVWTPYGESPAGVVQFLRNKGGLQFEDVTNTVLYNTWLGQNESSHEAQLMDVNGDGFVDIVMPAPPQLGAGGMTAKTWSNEIYVNTGAGKFVSVMWEQFHTLSVSAGASYDGKFYPYMTPDGRLGFISEVDTMQGLRFFEVLADDKLYTGPGGLNPALRGAAGFNEAYYLTENPSVAVAVTAGAYASGLEHYLAVGRAQGLQGFAANAQVAGSSGADFIQLREGNERAFGGAGGDTLSGLGGMDYLRGEDGDDSISGGDGFDDVHGNAGNDTVSGGAGGDWVVGGKDDDRLSGDDGDDVVYGNLGNDTQFGGDGVDWVRGGQGDDVLDAGAGDDWIAGDRGDDTITGGVGADLFHTHGGAGLDRVLDFNRAEGDRVNLLPGTTYTTAQVGADVVISMDGGGRMVLVGVQLASLTGDWIFGA